MTFLSTYKMKVNQNVGHSVNAFNSIKTKAYPSHIINV